MKSFDLENKIKTILEVNTTARCNDMYLYLAYVELELHDPDINNTFIEIFRSSRLRKQLNLVTFTAVERARRKVQVNYPELKIKEVEEKRFNKQQVYELYNQGYNVEL